MMAGKRQWAVALLDSTAQSVVIAASVDSSPGSTWLEVVKDRADPDFSVELQCLTAAEVKKRNRLIKESESVHGQIAAKNAWVICVSLPSDQATFQCFSWNSKKGKFVGAGGWST